MLRPVQTQLDVPPDLPDGDPYGQLARWFIANDPARSINPWSAASIRDWVDRRIANGSTGLALQVLPSDPLALAAHAARYVSQQPQRADAWAEYATKHASFDAEGGEHDSRQHQAAVYFYAASVWRALQKFGRALWAADCAARLDPNPDYQALCESLRNR